VYAFEHPSLGVVGSLTPASGHSIFEALHQHGLPLAADQLRACCSRGAANMENSVGAQGSAVPGPPGEQQQDEDEEEETEARRFAVTVLSGLVSPCLQGALTAHLRQHGCQGLLHWAHKLDDAGLLLLPPERPADLSPAAAGVAQQQRLQQQQDQHTCWIAHWLVSPADARGCGGWGAVGYEWHSGLGWPALLPAPVWVGMIGYALALYELQTAFPEHPCCLAYMSAGGCPA
jgi:hypothetical protein